MSSCIRRVRYPSTADVSDTFTVSANPTGVYTSLLPTLDPTICPPTSA